jgi:hypothetical protein
MSEPTVDQLIRQYAKFLSSSWSEALAITSSFSHESGANDWKQANWEMLVEANLVKYGCRLVVYSGGADCSQSSRVSDPDVRATHRVIVRSACERLIDRLSGLAINVPRKGLKLSELVSVRDGWYYEEPPFDSVRTEPEPGIDSCILALRDVRFDLSPVVNGDD